LKCKAEKINIEKIFLMSYVRIWIHAVWRTKAREPILEEEFRDRICQHIVNNAKSKGIFIDTIGGYLEHLHCVMLLKADLSISKQMQLIKGESSHWVNKFEMVKGHFGWADEYFASSVSEENLDRVRLYIQHQKEHHRKITFLEEYNELLKRFGNVSSG
jgi:putative transposase